MNEYNKTIAQSFQQYLAWRIKQVPLGDRTSYYVEQIAAQWAKDYGKTQELRDIASQMPLAELAKELIGLEVLAKVYLSKHLDTP
jgi:hypothetical protein